MIVRRSSFATALAGYVFMSTASGQEIPDRSQRPTGQGTPVITLPAVTRARLSNGLGVWLVERHQLPLVAFSLVMQAGAEHDPATMPGLATMTADVIDEGTATRSSLEIADALDVLGATLTSSANVDATTISLSTITRHLDAALEVYADVVVHASFPPQEFERLRQQRLTLLLQQRDQAGTIASNAFHHILYGDRHPYGNNSAGTEASIGSLTRDDLVGFYGKFYSPDNGTLIVVGDARMEDLQPRLERLFGTWQPRHAPPATVPDPPHRTSRVVYLIDKPGAPQSEVRIGYPALARNTPDYFPVLVMNRMLGGQFSSRLNLNLREQKGYSYGVRSAFTLTRHPGPFSAGGAVVTAHTDGAIREFLYEIDRMRREGMTAEELSFVKKGLVGGFSLGLETSSQIMDLLTNVRLYDLPDDYYNHYAQGVDGVTLGDVSRVAARYLDSSVMAVVVVGDVATIRTGIEAMHVGDVVLCDIAGSPAPR